MKKAIRSICGEKGFLNTLGTFYQDLGCYNDNNYDNANRMMSVYVVRDANRIDLDFGQSYCEQFGYTVAGIGRY